MDILTDIKYNIKTYNFTQVNKRMPEKERINSGFRSKLEAGLEISVIRGFTLLAYLVNGSCQEMKHAYFHLCGKEHERKNRTEVYYDPIFEFLETFMKRDLFKTYVRTKTS